MFPTFVKSVLFIWSVALVVSVSSLTARAAAADLDPTFNGSAYQQPGGSGVTRTILQPDGKIIVAGSFEIVSGSVKDDIVRVNPDGTVDETFNAPKIFLGITAVGIQPDGKILVAGNASVASGLVAPIVRLNADGTLDNSFTPPFQLSAQNTGAILDLEILPNGKIVIGGSFSYTANSQTRTKIARLNADGSTDTAFLAATNYADVNDLAVQPDGKILGAAVLISGSLHQYKRLNPDGSEDTTFTLSNGIINSYKVQADGKILIGGSFSLPNGNFYNNRVARLNADGSVDSTFTGNLSNTVNKVEIAANGKILLGGSSSSALVRLNADGSTDSSFNATTVFNVRDILPLPDGKVILGGSGINRLNSDGTPDATFGVYLGNRGTVWEIARQTDGKVLIAGQFSIVGAIARQSLARLNADGSADATFSPNITTPNGASIIRALAVQPDNKIIVGGNFPRKLIRLNADGTADSSFAAPAISGISEVFDVAIQPDGKIIAVGTLYINYDTYRAILRFNADGSLDNSFQPSVPNNRIYKVVLQPDGKILIGGEFISVGGVSRSRIARLNADGTLDTTFNPGSGANNYVTTLDLQSNGKVIIGGAFTSVNGVNKSNIARLNADGSLDASFTTTTNSTVLGITVQANDKILVGGSFNVVNGTVGAGLARLNADGTVDASFNVGSGTYGATYTFLTEPNGKILVAGNFSRYKGAPRLSIFRLQGDSAPRRKLFDFDGDGRADISVFRPSNGFWYQLRSQNNTFYAVQFGAASDKPAPADYDGDGKTDIAVFREGASGYFYILNSSNNAFRFEQFGTTGDVPVGGDFDGDGKDDVAVYTEGSSAQAASSFRYRPSGTPTNPLFVATYGAGGDKPVVGDYDADGKSDIAVFRPANATWYVQRSSNNQLQTTAFGLSTDTPVPADYDGDGRTDIAVFRPSNGTWYTSQNAANNYGAIQFGASGDLPVPADYDGDGRADTAVFRPSNGAWYLNRTTSGFTGVAFGTSGDKPAPNAFIR